MALCLAAPAIYEAGRGGSETSELGVSPGSGTTSVTIGSVDPLMLSDRTTRLAPDPVILRRLPVKRSLQMQPESFPCAGFE